MTKRNLFADINDAFEAPKRERKGMLTVQNYRLAVGFVPPATSVEHGSARPLIGKRRAPDVE